MGCASTQSALKISKVRIGLHGEHAGSLADVLVALDRDREQVRQAGERARALAEERYTWDHQAREVEKLLDRATLAP